MRLARLAGIEPDPWQARVLRSASPRMLLNCSRQSGKSTVIALKALHKALYKPRRLTLLLSPSLRQSGELFKRVISAYGDLGRPVPADSETALTRSLPSCTTFAFPSTTTWPSGTYAWPRYVRRSPVACAVRKALRSFAVSAATSRPYASRARTS